MASPSTRPRRPSWFSRHPRLVRVGTLAVTFGVAAGLGVGYGLWSLICRGNRCPSIAVLESYQPKQTSKLYAVDGRFVAELGLERRTLVRIEDIPAVVRNAFVITEDKRFYSHAGIDWLRIPGSVLSNLRAGYFKEGFSTITMQLARNIFPEHLSREKSLVRKIKEARVAREIEQQYSKDRILELYLNQINLGSGAYGVETASQRYFGKRVTELNVAEAATLAAMPKAPGRYNPRRFPDRAVQRRNTIIELMRRASSISDADASLAKAYPLQLARRVESGDVAPYFVEWVRLQLEKKFGARLYDEGLRVYTSLDLDIQTAADRALENQLRAMEGGKYGKWTHVTYEQYQAKAAGSDDASANESPYIQGAAVVIDPRSGSVRALIGGRDFDDSKFNRATQALRQPGSTFKPIVYATAIQNGRSPATLIEDTPISLPQVDGSEWTPQNYDMKFEGGMPMRRGLYQSRNIIAIRVGMELGEQAVIDEARRFGISTPIPPYPSIFIGSADVYPLELIASYGTFANLGSRVAPNAIVRVENQRGEVIWQPRPARTQVLSPGEAWLMVSMMKDVVQRGTAAGSVWGAGFRVPSGGKTGTTNDGADVWYVGYTADLVAGVWMGFDKPQKIISNAQGGRLAAPAFTQMMLEVYGRKPTPPDWPRPDAIVQANACGPSGMYLEYFLVGTENDNGCGMTVGNPFLIPPAADTTTRTPHDAASGAPGPGSAGVNAAGGNAPGVSAAVRTGAAARTRARGDTTNPFKIPQSR